MRRIAILALSVWLAVFASIALFTLFWRIGYFRPHILWGLLVLLLTFTPMLWLAACVLWRCVRGPCRLRAVGWLLVGATPLVWSSAYLTQLAIDAHTTPQRQASALARVAGVWASSLLDIEAWWRYPRCTHGRHALLFDDGQTPSPEKLVSKMDTHIGAMADLLCRPVPNMTFPWVRGSLFGFHHGRAFMLWAICSQPRNPGDLCYVDRHEVAHTFITGLSGPDQDPPFVLVEGWAESQSRGRDDLLADLVRRRKDGKTFSLRTLVGADFYNLHNYADYSEGGPLVLYLMEHYGPETFFRLYSARIATAFRMIAGRSSATRGTPWKRASALARSRSKAARRGPSERAGFRQRFTWNWPKRLIRPTGKRSSMVIARRTRDAASQTSCLSGSPPTPPS